jgi:hypothetical protein
MIGQEGLIISRGIQISARKNNYKEKSDEQN